MYVTYCVSYALIDEFIIVFLCIDFKSIELRVLAHLSNDPSLLSALTSSSQSSDDVFVMLASEWYAD